METTLNSLQHEYLTVAEVQKYLNVSLGKAYELAHRKDFPVCRFGGSIRVPRDPFLAWVREKTYLPDWLGPVA